MIELIAHAKVNLTLRVRPRDESGLHPLHSLVQSVDLGDAVAVGLAGEDHFDVSSREPVERDQRNLALRAAQAVRAEMGTEQPLRVRLDKLIPMTAGLGGGSADAAAALVAAAGSLGGDRRMVEGLAFGLGADVPFCLTGGTLWMEGHGEGLRPADVAVDYHLALAVPRYAFDTGAVYARWDELGGPEGPYVGGADLPPALRDIGPLVNDLTPAARSMHPDFADWAADVAAAWGRAVLMTGSGPAVVGFFPTIDEAAEAAAAAADVRFAGATSPVDRGWDGDPGGTLPPPPWGVV